MGQEDVAQRKTLSIAGSALDGSKWDGLYLGRRKGENLIYAGKVGAPPAADQEDPALQQAHSGIWVEPELLAESKVRHPFFKGLREDL